MDRLIQLEEEELKEKFHVNDCFIDVISSGIYYYAYKVIRVNADSILVVKVLRDHIEQKITTSSATTNWEKITSEQFDTLLKLCIDVINNPDDDIRLLQHLIDDNIMRGHPNEKKFIIHKYTDMFDDAATEKVVCIKYISTITYKDI